MSGWTRHRGHAVGLPLENVDTDQIIPARFMSTPRSKGYGRFLMYDLRFDEGGTEVLDFPLNRHRNGTVLITRRNFGSGSSREAAVYALADFGIVAVIAPSFGDIFAANAVNNGVLPARVDAAIVEDLMNEMGAQSAPVEIDLEGASVHLLGRSLSIEIGDVEKRKLINGWDDIDLTESYTEQIAVFRDQRFARNRWAWPKEAEA